MTSSAPSALERALLTGAPAGRAEPQDALRAARQMWLADQRVDMGRLAAELRISRATLYNWVGDRERLMGEVLWSIAARTISHGRRAATGTGAPFIASVVEHYLSELARFEPNRLFVSRDPELALRVLTSQRSPFQQRLIRTLSELIEEQVAAAGYQPPLDPETLAYVIVRIGESFIFNDLITGSEPDLAKAAQACRVVLHATPLEG